MRIPKENLEPGHIYYLQVEVSGGTEVQIWKDPARVRIDVPPKPFVHVKFLGTPALSVSNTDPTKTVFKSLDVVKFTWDYSRYSSKLGANYKTQLLLIDFSAEHVKMVKDIELAGSHSESLGVFFGDRIGFAWFLI